MSSYVPGMPDAPEVPKSGITANPFWIGIAVVWILMVVVGLTLALALGIWNIWQAF